MWHALCVQLAAWQADSASLHRRTAQQCLCTYEDVLLTALKQTARKEGVP
jgi:hypothetical protein